MLGQRKNPMMTTQGLEPFESLMARVHERNTKRRNAEDVAELAKEIDRLSGEMGVPAFRDAIRSHGYDVDADMGMLMRRGVDRTQH